MSLVQFTRDIFRDGTYPATLLGGISVVNQGSTQFTKELVNDGTNTPQEATKKSTRIAFGRDWYVSPESL